MTGFIIIVAGFVVSVTAGMFHNYVGAEGDWIVLYVLAAMLACSTYAFIRRRRILEPMFGGSFGKFEPLAARMVEILTYGFLAYWLFVFCLRYVIWFMPHWLLQPSMWSEIVIFTGFAFLCWSYSQNLRGRRREVALSAATGSLVTLGFEAVDYVGTQYKLDWIYAGGFYLLTPVILAFFAARIFADKPLQRYIDAYLDEQLPLRRLHDLRLIFRPSWWEKTDWGFKEEDRIRRLS